MVKTLVLSLLLIAPIGWMGCGPSKKPKGPRAEPWNHYYDCTPWCSARSLNSGYHVRVPR